MLTIYILSYNFSLLTKQKKCCNSISISKIFYLTIAQLTLKELVKLNVKQSSLIILLLILVALKLSIIVVISC